MTLVLTEPGREEGVLSSPANGLLCTRSSPAPTTSGLTVLDTYDVGALSSADAPYAATGPRMASLVSV